MPSIQLQIGYKREIAASGLPPIPWHAEFRGRSVLGAVSDAGTLSNESPEECLSDGVHQPSEVASGRQHICIAASTLALQMDSLREVMQGVRPEPPMAPRFAGGGCDVAVAVTCELRRKPAHGVVPCKQSGCHQCIVQMCQADTDAGPVETLLDLFTSWEATLPAGAGSPSSHLGGRSAEEESDSWQFCFELWLQATEANICFRAAEQTLPLALLTAMAEDIGLASKAQLSVPFESASSAGMLASLQVAVTIERDVARQPHPFASILGTSGAVTERQEQAEAHVASQSSSAAPATAAANGVVPPAAAACWARVCEVWLAKGRLRDAGGTFSVERRTATTAWARESVPLHEAETLPGANKWLRLLPGDAQGHHAFHFSSEGLSLLLQSSTGCRLAAVLRDPRSAMRHGPIDSGCVYQREWLDITSAEWPGSETAGRILVELAVGFGGASPCNIQMPAEVGWPLSSLPLERSQKTGRELATATRTLLGDAFLENLASSASPAVEGCAEKIEVSRAASSLLGAGYGDDLAALRILISQALPADEEPLPLSLSSLLRWLSVRAIARYIQPAAGHVLKACLELEQGSTPMEHIVATAGSVPLSVLRQIVAAALGQHRSDSAQQIGDPWPFIEAWPAWSRGEHDPLVDYIAFFADLCAAGVDGLTSLGALLQSGSQVRYGRGDGFSSLKGDGPAVVVDIANALHLPLVDGRSPNTFVSYRWHFPGAPHDQLSPYDQALGRTDVIYCTTCPAWDESFRLTLPQGADRRTSSHEYPEGFSRTIMLLHIWHVDFAAVASGGPGMRARQSDVLIGTAAVPLAPLHSGFAEVDGYFHIEAHSEGGAHGQLHVKVRPCFASFCSQSTPSVSPLRDSAHVFSASTSGTTGNHALAEVPLLPLLADAAAFDASSVQQVSQERYTVDVEEQSHIETMAARVPAQQSFQQLPTLAPTETSATGPLPTVFQARQDAGSLAASLGAVSSADAAGGLTRGPQQPQQPQQQPRDSVVEGSWDGQILDVMTMLPTFDIEDPVVQPLAAPVRGQAVEREAFLEKGLSETELRLFSRLSTNELALNAAAPPVGNEDDIQHLRSVRESHKQNMADLDELQKHLLSYFDLPPVLPKTPARDKPTSRRPSEEPRSGYLHFRYGPKPDQVLETLPSNQFDLAAAPAQQRPQKQVDATTIEDGGGRGAARMPRTAPISAGRLPPAHKDSAIAAAEKRLHEETALTAEADRVVATEVAAAAQGPALAAGAGPLPPRCTPEQASQRVATPATKAVLPPNLAGPVPQVALEPSAAAVLEPSVPTAQAPAAEVAIHTPMPARGKKHWHGESSASTRATPWESGAISSCPATWQEDTSATPERSSSPSQQPPLLSSPVPQPSPSWLDGNTEASKSAASSPEARQRQVETLPPPPLPRFTLGWHELGASASSSTLPLPEAAVLAAAEEHGCQTDERWSDTDAQAPQASRLAKAAASSARELDASESFRALRLAQSHICARRATPSPPARTRHDRPPATAADSTQDSVPAKQSASRGTSTRRLELSTRWQGQLDVQTQRIARIMRGGAAEASSSDSD
eukprot:TRINITY_DN14485_c0_g3_i4.p1 TRINITY_DN14485_c0_g3~~TRINITY_DN14485_c0_g3_i4.p1  ORF type:complete len:1672 (+),score=330.41 TRINITY_DN14485_c0_g3_i4:333-5018(+)